MTTLHIPDISKWQSSVDLSKVGPVVILRGHNGYKTDHTFGQRFADARRYQKVRGIYGYVVEDRDVVEQAKELAAVVGRLRRGEFLVADVEEGKGDQAARAEAYCSTLDRLCGGRSWLYTGLSFHKEHGLAKVKRPLWVAAYRDVEPTAPPHVLWQHTNHELHPGIGYCDCSVYHGTVAQLHAFVSPPPKAKPKARPKYRRLLEEGARGADVKRLQADLGKLEVDGIFGPETKARLIAWQRGRKDIHGRRLVADGIFGPLTAGALGWST